MKFYYNGVRFVDGPSDYLRSLGIPEFNVGGNYNAGLYWKPNDPSDPYSTPVWVTEEDHFAQFQRAGTKWLPDANGVYRSYGTNTPAFTWQSGIRRLVLENTATNKVTCRKHNPTDTSNLSKSGDAAATLTVVDDVAALAAAGLSQLCTNGKVYCLDNTAGTVAAIVSSQGAVSNTNLHQYTAFIRGGTGAIGNNLTSVGRTTFAASATYRQLQASYASSDTTSRWSVTANAGQVVYFILPRLVEGAFVGSIIPGDTLAAVTRVADFFRHSAAHEAVLQESAASALVKGQLIRPLADNPPILGQPATSYLLGAISDGRLRTSNMASVLSATAGSGSFLTRYAGALSFNASGRSLCFNAGTVATDSASVQADRSAIRLGGRANIATGDGYYDLSAAAPERISNARLSAITVI